MVKALLDISIRKPLVAFGKCGFTGMVKYTIMEVLGIKERFGHEGSRYNNSSERGDTVWVIKEDSESRKRIDR